MSSIMAFTSQKSIMDFNACLHLQCDFVDTMYYFSMFSFVIHYRF